MSNSKRPTAPTFVSFKGTFKYPKLHAPDYGNDEFPKPNGEFSLKLVGKADDPEVKALIAKLKPFHDAAIKQAEAEFKTLKVDARKKLGKVTVNPLYAEIYDEETEEPTGEIEFKFAMDYSGEYKKGPKAGKKWYRVPAIFDAAGKRLPYFDRNFKPIENAPSIWGGTIGRISFELGLNKEGQPGYFIPGSGLAGLKLRLQAAKIIDLVSGGERNADAYGFGEAEEGYTHDPSQFSGGSDSGDGDTDTSGDTGGVDGTDENPDF